jgi:CheY-like chemotaxis protein
MTDPGPEIQTDPPCTVLVVEDDHDVREALEEVLGGAGYGVITARHGAEALTHLRSGSLPALILLDLSMPVMDGAAFCAEQKKDPRLAPIPIIVLSAAGALADKVSALAVAGYLRKPVRLDDLLTTVERFCSIPS